MRSKKIINDPVYGFIDLPTGWIGSIIQRPVFQRLRRIRQLGFANMVYHGAEHTRFQHALGAMHLMTNALDMLSGKGIQITQDEREAAQAAILLHDLGHGPFSHSLEGLLLPYHHERLTLALMRQLNASLDGKLDLAIQIFTNVHEKPFLHELVSSQLDMDRLDYLNRDRFFTGVSEGVVGYDRIIHMLNVVDGRLAVEEKGIYSVEKFLVARRLMYWQVYLHKTSLSAEVMLRQIIARVKELLAAGKELPSISDALRQVLTTNWPSADVVDPRALDLFADLDDYDVIMAIKQWRKADDVVLSYLCKALYYRRMYQTRIGTREQVDEWEVEIREQVGRHVELGGPLALSLVHRGIAENSAYKSNLKNILILYKDGHVADISAASEDLDIRALSEAVQKHYISYPRA